MISAVQRPRCAEKHVRYFFPHFWCGSLPARVTPLMRSIYLGSMSTSKAMPRPLFPFQFPTVVLLTGAEHQAARVGRLLESGCKTQTIADWNEAFLTLQQDKVQHSSYAGYAGHLTACDPDFGDHWQMGDRQLSFRPPSIESLRAVARRHDTVAVVIVAASLDDDDALAFCRSIGELGVRVLWVAETASLSAIALLNERAVHAVLFADAHDLPAKLPSLVEQLTAEYFDRLTAPLQTLLDTGTTQFLNHPAAQQLVCETRSALAADEYYVTSDPPGVMLIGKVGASFLLISDGEYLAAQREIAAEEPAHSNLAAVPHGGGFYEQSAAFSWRNVAWNSIPLEGAPQWSHALIHESFDNGHLFDGLLARKN